MVATSCSTRASPRTSGTVPAQLLDAIAQIGESWRPELFSYARHRFYQNSPYRFDDLGSADVVAKASREELNAFYHRLVTGPDTVLAISAMWTRPWPNRSLGVLSQ